MLSLVALLDKYAFRMQNPYLFIDYSIEGIAVAYWRGGEWYIAFTTQVNRLAICLQ